MLMLILKWPFKAKSISKLSIAMHNNTFQKNDNFYCGTCGARWVGVHVEVISCPGQKKRI